MVTNSRFEQALAGIDAINAEDPNRIDVDGTPQPAELVYGSRMTNVLARLYPAASEQLQIAVRAQHVRRWSLPRSDYPMDRGGYHRWRNALKRKHAALAGEVMAACGYPGSDVMRVQSLIEKRDIKSDPEAQALEDVACLVFLQYYAADFSVKHADDKVVQILAKTWAKMSDRGRAGAQDLDLPDRLSGLLHRALAAQDPA